MEPVHSSSLALGRELRVLGCRFFQVAKVRELVLVRIQVFRAPAQVLGMGVGVQE